VHTDRLQPLASGRKTASAGGSPTNAIERLNEEFRRRIKTQTVPPQAETAPTPLLALLASSQIVMRKVVGWETLDQPLANQPIDLAA
jgi:hypothetical protein